MNCIFKKENDCWICENCGFRICGQFSTGINRNCQAPKTVKTTINRATDVVKAVKDVATGQLVSSEEQNKRLEICRECEHFKKNKCELCGCFLNFKTKVASSNCPIGKW